jgi:cell volume regulation protein A
MIWTSILLAAPAATPAAAPEGGLIVDQTPITTLPMEGLITVVSLAFLATLVASKVSIRLGIPAILGVLLLGVLINADYSLLSPQGVEALHVVSLAMLLFYAGLSTNFGKLRQLLSFGLCLAVGGVVVSSGLLGAAIWAVTHGLGQVWPATMQGLPFAVCLLIAASLGSTDAGATLSVLRGVGRLVPERVKYLVEFESSVNDPSAILFLYLVIGLTASHGASDPGGSATFMLQIQNFIKSIGSGIMVGLILTYIAQFILRSVVTSRDQVLVVGLAVAMSSYGVATLLGGSGFISAYVTGCFLANNIYDNPYITQEVMASSLEPFNTLMELTVFLLFGVLFDPAYIPGNFVAGLLISGILMLLVRPLSVLIFQPLTPLNKRETALVCWCGLRGAVPLALAYSVVHALPHIKGLSEAQAASMEPEVQGLIFVVVVSNLLVQGLSLPRFCRWLNPAASG